MTKDIEFIVPTDISDITVRQYIEWHKIYSSWDREDMDYLSIKMLQIFCGISPDETKNINLKLFNNTINNILDLLSKECELKRTFTMLGTDGVEVEFGFIPNLDDMSYGEWLDIEQYFSDINNSHKLLSVFYRPLKHKNKAGMYLIHDYEGSDKYSSLMLDAPVDVLLGSKVFFYHLGNRLLIHSLSSINKMMEKAENLTIQQKEFLEENGERINRYTHLLKEMYLILNPLKKQTLELV